MSDTPTPIRLSDDDECRRDSLDLAEVRRRHDAHELPMGPAGRYVDLYIRAGFPTKALSFALVAWGVGELVRTARYVYVMVFGGLW
jgi:hypothetical protein